MISGLYIPTILGTFANFHCLKETELHYAHQVEDSQNDPVDSEIISHLPVRFYDIPDYYIDLF